MGKKHFFFFLSLDKNASLFLESSMYQVCTPKTLNIKLSLISCEILIIVYYYYCYYTLRIMSKHFEKGIKHYEKRKKKLIFICVNNNNNSCKIFYINKLTCLILSFKMKFNQQECIFSKMVIYI